MHSGDRLPISISFIIHIRIPQKDLSSSYYLLTAFSLYYPLVSPPSGFAEAPTPETHTGFNTPVSPQSSALFALCVDAFIGLKRLLCCLPAIYSYIQAVIPLLTKVCGHIMQFLYLVSNVIQLFWLPVCHPVACDVWIEDLLVCLDQQFPALLALELLRMHFFYTTLANSAPKKLNFAFQWKTCVAKFGVFCILINWSIKCSFMGWDYPSEANKTLKTYWIMSQMCCHEAQNIFQETSQDFSVLRPIKQF